jgi:O-antigen/teichoic acid export membrane protein
VIGDGGYLLAFSRGVGLLLLGRTMAYACVFVFQVLLARILQPSAFGLLNVGIVVTSYASLLTDFGLHIVGGRDLVRNGSRSGVSLQVILGRLLIAVTFLSIGAAGLLVAQPAVEVWVIAAILGSTLIAAALSLNWALQAQGRFLQLAIIEAVSGFFQLAVGVVVVHSSSDLVPAVVAVATAPWVTAILAAVASRFRGALRRPTMRTIRVLASGFPLAIAMLAISLYYTVDSILLALWRPAEEVGYYAAAYRLVIPVLAIAVAAQSVALPMLVRLRASSNEVRALVEAMSQVLVTLALPAAIGAALMADIIVATIFGENFAAAALPLSLLVFSWVTVFANVPFGALLLATNRDLPYMWIAVGGALANLSANLVAIPLLGMLGAAVTTLAAELFVLASMVWLTSEIAVPALRRTLATVLLPTILMCLAVLPVRYSLVGIPIGAAVYILTLGVVYRWKVASLATRATRWRR